MTFLPVVERELRVTSRLSATYRVRMFMPMLVAGIGLLHLWLTPGLRSRSTVGIALFHTLSTLALAFCVLEGVRKAADCVSGEKRDGTLGLLFLTDLKGYDVILGKLAAASLTSLCGLFAILPILGWSVIFLGGVTLGEIWRVGFASAGVLCFSLAVGIWVSARSYSASRAMASTLLVVLLFLLLPLPMVPSPIAPLSPACAFFGSSDLVYRVHPLQFWISLLLTLVFGWAFLANASATISRFAEEGEIQAAKSARSSSSKFSKRARPPEDNPILWLASRGRNPAWMIWILVVMTGMGVAACLYLSYHYNAAFKTFMAQQQILSAPPSSQGNLFNPAVLPPPAIPRQFYIPGWCLIVFVAIMNSLMKVLLASQACRCLAEARRGATLELLLTTPLKIQDILDGQILALRRTYLRPALVLLACEIAGLFWLLQQNVSPMQLVPTVVIAETAFAIFFLVDLQAVAWVAMWFGLCSKNESRAMFKTIFFTILLPYLLLVLYCLGWAMFVFWPIGALLWARLQLQEQFRALAGYRPSANGEPSAWMAYEIPAPVKEEV
jgi:ABC-2 family transporter protein